MAEEHGPQDFELLFSKSEGVATLKAAFNSRHVPPKCLVHVRSGIGFGGNFSGYPGLLEKSLRLNKGGLPEFIFHDSMAVGGGGDHLGLIDEYEERERWGYSDGGYLRLASSR